MAINIAVLVKQIPDPSQVGSLDSDFRYIRDGKIVLDDADLYGVEMALQLRDKAGGGNVIAISMAPNDESIGVRTALQMGADNGLIVSDPKLANSHSLATAKVLNAAINTVTSKGESIDLVIAGTESSDGYAGTVPAQLAALRKISALTFATSVDLQDQTITIKRQSNEGIDVVSASLPAVVSVTAGVVEPRYPNFKDIMAAKSKPIEVLTLSDLGITEENLAIKDQQVIAVEDIQTRTTGEKITDVEIAPDKIIEVLEAAGVL